MPFMLLFPFKIDIAERNEEGKTDTTSTDADDLLRDTSTLLKQVLRHGISIFASGNTIRPKIQYYALAEKSYTKLKS